MSTSRSEIFLDEALVVLTSDVRDDRCAETWTRRTERTASRCSRWLHAAADPAASHAAAACQQPQPRDSVLAAEVMSIPPARSSVEDREQIPASK